MLWIACRADFDVDIQSSWVELSSTNTELFQREIHIDEESILNHDKRAIWRRFDVKSTSIRGRHGLIGLLVTCWLSTMLCSWKLVGTVEHAIHPPRMAWVALFVRRLRGKRPNRFTNFRPPGIEPTSQGCEASPLALSRRASVQRYARDPWPAEQHTAEWCKWPGRNLRVYYSINERACWFFYPSRIRNLRTSRFQKYRVGFTRRLRFNIRF